MRRLEPALPKPMLITGSDKRRSFMNFNIRTHTHSHAQVLMDGAAEAA